MKGILMKQEDLISAGTVAVCLMFFFSASSNGKEYQVHPETRDSIQISSDGPKISNGSPPIVLSKKYPDEPITKPEPQPVSVKFVIEHRSAISSFDSVIVTGIVVKFIHRTCPADILNFKKGDCVLGSEITLADKNASNRDRKYDLQILLDTLTPGQDPPFEIGKPATITGRFFSNVNGVVMGVNY